MSVRWYKTAEEAERELRKEYYYTRTRPGWKGVPDRYVEPFEAFTFPLVKKKAAS